METTIKVKSFTHDELVTLLADSSYSNSAVELDADDTVYAEAKGSAFEDKLAYIWLNGDKIIIIDRYAEGENMASHTDFEPTFDEDGNALFEITLEQFISTLNKAIEAEPKRFNAVTETLDGEGDMFTAWNVLQCGIFGEEIYG